MTSNLALLTTVVLLACQSSTEPGNERSARAEGGEPPRQLFIVGNPEVFKAYAPRVVPETQPDSVLVVLVTAPDSTFASNWWPTEILIETDGGYREVLRLRPRHCLLPANTGLHFPFNFQWWSCDQVVINTTVVLSPQRLREVVQVAGGDTVYTWRFRTMPGGHYVFRVGTGLTATAAAVERLARLPEVEEASRILDDPMCVVSDVLPPPPCPPWRLIINRPFVSDRATAGGDTIPIRRGGWIRATYTQPDGSERTTTTTLPP